MISSDTVVNVSLWRIFYIKW